MKRKIYIFEFVVLGFLLQLLAHGLVEIWYINLLMKNFATYGFGLSWNTWFWIHHVETAILALLGIWLGYKQGVYWWHRMYELDRASGLLRRLFGRM